MALLLNLLKLISFTKDFDYEKIRLPVCLINFSFEERPETAEILFESVKFREISTASKPL